MSSIITCPGSIGTKTIAASTAALIMKDRTRNEIPPRAANSNKRVGVMADVVSLGISAISGGGLLALFQGVTGWAEKRREGHLAKQSAQQENDARLEEHRDKLTFDLLTAARSEMAALREEVATLRPINARIAHLEEALDHIHALLNAEGDLEMRSARRRAKAYLRRMRPEVGDLRNAAQAQESAKNILGDLGGIS